MSPWKKPSPTAWRKKFCISNLDIFFKSILFLISNSLSLIEIPSTFSIVKTLCDVKSQNIDGTLKPSS